jgi:N-acyl-D-amino-acid deacylase
VRVEISHFKASGRRHWPKQRVSLDLVESSRRAGVNVLADAYPYAAYSTNLAIFLQPWAREGGKRAIVERLRDPNQSPRIRKETLASVHNDPGEFDLIVISRTLTEKNRSFVGKNLVEIGSLLGVEPVDALLRLLEEEETNVSFVGHGMSEENVEMVLGHPLVMIGSDGESIAPVGKAAQTRPHPRSYGAFARVLGHYARERHLFDLPTAIRKMTSMPADQVGLGNRGRIARGQKADVVLFDAGTIADRASFADPHRYPAGIVHVVVNGVLVVRDGRHTGARPGRVLRKT